MVQYSVMTSKTDVQYNQDFGFYTFVVNKSLDLMFVIWETRRAGREIHLVMCFKLCDTCIYNTCINMCACSDIHSNCLQGQFMISDREMFRIVLFKGVQ